MCRICGSHIGVYEEFYFLGYNAVQSTKNQLTFDPEDGDDMIL
jgi:hypothetical protein